MAARKKKAARKKAGTKAPARKSAPIGRTRPLSKEDKATLAMIEGTADRVKKHITRRALPELKLPIRALSNVKYDKRVGYFQIGRGTKARHLSVNTVKNFAQTLKLMAVSKEMVENDDFATKREAYYVSKNWQEAKFNEQSESDAVMDDIEALASVDGLSREHLRFYPEEHGGSVAGGLTIIDRDKKRNQPIRIDCTRMGTGSYSIPHSVEHLKFETSAKFILVIETSGMFQRLNEHEYWDTGNCILIAMGGVPTRATRRFVRRLSESRKPKLPVYAFVDCDPYGIANIYRTLKVGSGNAAHINRFFCVPNAQYLGVTPQDIADFKLEDATHDLKPVDVKRAKDAIKNDPFFSAHKEWQKALTMLLKMGVRAEQQALAKWGLNYVIEEYLPRKLKNKKAFLP